MDEEAYKQGWNDALLALDNELFGSEFEPYRLDHSNMKIRVTINELSDR